MNAAAGVVWPFSDIALPPLPLLETASSAR
jgi:hypothetical protein